MTGAATAGDWLTFTLNTQDFAYPERSAATVDRIITLHETYRVPVDIYLTDASLAIFETNYPALVTRLRTSPYVALDYHIRPPKPYYTGYDWAGLSVLSAAEQIAQIKNYESHVTDLVTGLPGTTEGGFTRLKQLTGSSPVIAALQADAALHGSVAQAFREMGASMTISHTAPYINLGTTTSGLYVRPEHFDLKLFQSPGQASSGLIETAFTAAHTTFGVASPYVTYSRKRRSVCPSSNARRVVEGVLWATRKPIPAGVGIRCTAAIAPRYIRIGILARIVQCNSHSPNRTHAEICSHPILAVVGRFFDVNARG